jgi:hypothetical protein
MFSGDTNKTKLRGSWKKFRLFSFTLLRLMAVPALNADQPSPEGRGCREATGEGCRNGISSPLIRPFGPPSPFGRRMRIQHRLHAGQTR